MNDNKKTRNVTIKNLKMFLKHDLKKQIESDKRLKLLVKNQVITEYTLQAIIWDHISRYVGKS